jgi:hypothetical protein
VAIGAALKLPPTVVKTLALPKVTTRITPDQVAFWIDVMNRQNMLKNKPDPTMLIWP